MATSYDAKKVNGMFGVLPLLGEGEGDFVTITPLDEGASVSVGARGHAVVVDSNNRAYEVTVNLAANAEGRNTLSALTLHHSAGNPFLPLAITSSSTGETFMGGNAKIKKMPDVTFGSGSPNREVVFVVPNGKFVMTAEV